MTAREQVLRFLLSAQRPLSGQDMAARIGCSRMAVCKAISDLREEGFEIWSRTRAGYQLTGIPDRLHADLLRAGLQREHTVYLLEQVDSTNNYLRDHPDLPDGTVVVARTQTGGRGRRGKSFSSPADKGVYFSFSIQRSIPAEQMWAVTFMAAVAVTGTLQQAGADARIKWVNDVYVGGKKICGILTEVTMDAESRESSRILVGIGVNLKKGGLPPELADVATTLEDQGVTLSGCDAITGIVNRFDQMLSTFDISAILESYRRDCFVPGCRVRFERDGIRYVGVATSVLDNGNLAVECDGEQMTLSSGEIFVLEK